MLKQLDPDARFEQVCDLEAMRRISKDRTYKPERTIVGALETPKVVDSDDERHRRRLQSKGKWYQFSFTCETTADHMKVQAFSVPDRRADPAGAVGEERAVVGADALRPTRRRSKRNAPRTIRLIDPTIRAIASMCVCGSRTEVAVMPAPWIEATCSDEFRQRA